MGKKETILVIKLKLHYFEVYTNKISAIDDIFCTGLRTLPD